MAKMPPGKDDSLVRDEQAMVFEARTSELDSLAQFARRFPCSLEALSAKFLIGFTFCLGVPGYPEDTGLPCFDDTATNYSETREGLMSRWAALGLRVWEMVEQQRQSQMHKARPVDRKAARDLLVELLTATKDLLPVAANVDADASEFGRTYRVMLLSRLSNPEDHKLLPVVRGELAQVLSALGRSEEAREAYRGIIRDFPGTRDAREAEIRLGTMDGQDKEGWRQPLETLLAGEKGGEADARAPVVPAGARGSFWGARWVGLVSCGAAAVLGFCIVLVVLRLRRRQRDRA